MREIQKISITDMAAENIKELITNGEYRPGQKLPTEAISVKCSALAVPASVKRYEFYQALGYVTIKSGKGTFVSEKMPGQATEQWYEADDAQFSDFMEVRFAIEPLAIRLSSNVQRLRKLLN